MNAQIQVLGTFDYSWDGTFDYSWAHLIIADLLIQAKCDETEHRFLNPWEPQHAQTL